jgi:integrase
MGRAANGRSSIYQAGDGRWHGWVSMGTGPGGTPIRHHVADRTRTGVTAKVKRLEQDRDAGVVTSTARTTLATYLAEWILRKEKLRVVRPNTIDGYRVDEKHVAAAIGKVRLDRLTPGNVEHLWAHLLDRGLTVGHCRRTLNAALNDAVKRGFIARNPVKAAAVVGEPQDEIVPYTLDQMTALLHAAKGSRNAARWTLALALGLRQGEVLGAHWDDVALPAKGGTEGSMTIRRQLQRVTWQHGCPDPGSCLNRAGKPAKRGADCPQRWGGGLKVSEPKSHAGRRTLTLPVPVADELRAHRQSQRAERLASEIWEQGPDGGWVFANARGGPTDPRADDRDFKDLCREANVPPKRLHDLRHSAATMMLSADLDQKTTGQVLGHSRTAQTDRYLHVLEDRKSVAAARIADALFGHQRGES